MILKTANGYQSFSTQELFTINRTIFLEGDVNSKSCMSIAKEIIYLSKENSDDINLVINSLGGSIVDGLIIYDVIQAIRCDVRTIGFGTCASMGAFLLSSGTKGKRCILPHTKVLIHDPLIQGTTSLNVSQAIELGKNLKETRDQMNEIIAKNTGKSIEEINKATKKETWFTAKEAVEFGLCDNIINKLGGEIYE